MTRPKKIVVNCTTGESQELELTDLEIQQLEADAAAALEQKAQEEAKAMAKAAAKASAQAKLATLGLTADEVSVLLG
jgi:hypothetical protein